VLAIGGSAAWRAQRAARARARALSELAAEEAERLAELGDRLNRHGFELQHTLDHLAPKVEAWSAVLRRPLVAATIPWVIRRVLGRPLKRRH
jgi:hypothetical protein